MQSEARLAERFARVLCLAVLLHAQCPLGTRLRRARDASAPSPHCSAELPIAEGVKERTAWGEVITKVMPHKDQGVVNANEVVEAAEKYGAQDSCREEIYGEIAPEGAIELFGLVNLTDSDTFVDLGSGLGKLPVQAAVLGGAAAARGVELSAKRHDMACRGLRDVSAALQEKLKGQKRRMVRVELLLKDIMEEDLSEVSVVFTNSVCLRSALMTALGQKLARELPRGARVATSNPFPQGYPKRLADRKTHHVAMSWAEYHVDLYRAEGDPSPSSGKLRPTSYPTF